MKINAKIKKIFFLFLVFFSGPLFANWFLISGNYSSEWRLELTSEMSSATKNLFILFDYYEPYNYSNGFCSQQVVTLSKDFKGDSFTETKTFDVENQLKRLLIPLKKGSFFMHKSYKFKSDLALDSFFVDGPYPHKNQNDLGAYMIKSDLPEEMKDKIKLIVKDKTKIVDVILSLSNWIKNDFQFCLSAKKISMREAFRTKQINLEIAIELWVSCLRQAGIPARIVHGYSLLNQIYFEKGDEQVVIHYPRGPYHWIEFFSENLGWIPIDPWANVFFFTPQNLVRKTVSVHFKNKQDRIFIYPKRVPDFNFTYNIFSEKESKEKKYKIESVIESSDYFFSPPSNTLEKPVKEKNYPMRFLPDSLDLYQNPLKIDVEVIEDKDITRKIVFQKPKKINTISIPLYFLEINRFGQLWLEIKNSEGKTFKTEIVKSNFDHLDLKYKIITFKMPHHLILQGNCYFTLKIKNLATVFWYGIIGNPIGDKNDTFRDKSHFLHLDLCYEIK